MIPEGFLLIDKPAGWTSHDAVGYLRGVTGIKRVGHAGTLDPFATGLLILGIGRATARLDELHAFDKEYQARLRFGAVSTTGDPTGEIVELSGEKIERPTLEAALEKFRGEIDQVPPMYSAKKIHGRRLYELARAGETVERAPCRVTIHELELLNWNHPMAEMRVVCSTGTYIRSLAADLGQALGSGAYLTELRRTRIGKFRVEDALEPKQFEKSTWQKRLIEIGEHET